MIYYCHYDEQYVPGSYLIHRQKIDELVEFPIEGLDLSDCIKRCGAPVHEHAPPVYDLYAVSEHEVQSIIFNSHTMSYIIPC